jgi:hypothetical protein
MYLIRVRVASPRLLVLSKLVEALHDKEERGRRRRGGQPKSGDQRREGRPEETGATGGGSPRGLGWWRQCQTTTWAGTSHPPPPPGGIAIRTMAAAVPCAERGGARRERPLDTHARATTRRWAELQRAGPEDAATHEQTKRPCPPRPRGGRRKYASARRGSAISRANRGGERPARDDEGRSKRREGRE